MLFSNRRLAGNAEAEICDYIATKCDIPSGSIYLCGIEQLELWLKNFPEVVRAASLDPVDSLLIVSPDDLAEVVQALARQRDELNAVLDDPPTPRVTYEQKKAINNMAADYAKAQRQRYLKETAQIRAGKTRIESDVDRTVTAPYSPPAQPTLSSAILPPARLRSCSLSRRLRRRITKRRSSL